MIQLFLMFKTNLYYMQIKHFTNIFNMISWYSIDDADLENKLQYFIDVNNLIT